MAQERLLAQPNAWLLDFGQSVRAAVGVRILLQIIDRPNVHDVPCTPGYCHSVLSWQGRLLPVMDMAARLGGVPQAPQYLVVVGYQDSPDEPTRFGALLVSAPPAAIVVGDTQSCALPEQPADWGKFACSCFEHEGAAIPVLHLGRIFSSPPDA
jgi:chemotaxis signal transduction protein